MWKPLYSSVSCSDRQSKQMMACTAEQLLLQTLLEESFGLKYVTSGLIELNVVKDAIGEVLMSHVGVGSSANEEAQRGVVVELVSSRVNIAVY